VCSAVEGKGGAFKGGEFAPSISGVHAARLAVTPGSGAVVVEQNDSSFGVTVVVR
jgi:hypothetical protein